MDEIGEKGMIKGRSMQLDISPALSKELCMPKL